MNPKARHAYLTLIGDKPLLNVVLENNDIFCIEITESHLCNIVQDGVRIAFRPERETHGARSPSLRGAGEAK